MATPDHAKIDEILTRGVDTIYPSADALRAKLASGKKLRIYNGIDPTADTLHIGHLAALQKLRQFQDLGHEVIMLIGDFTGMIGDPTGKSKTRVQLTRRQVNEHARRYVQQASCVLDGLKDINLELHRSRCGAMFSDQPPSPKYIQQMREFFEGQQTAKQNGALLVRNGTWWDGIHVFDFLESMAPLVTVQRILERDMFQERIRKGEPIGFHELTYPILQGYDSVAMEVDVEIGGTDQTFNMLMGRDYVRKMQDREKFVITVPLLTDASGKKIGKSEGNMVELGVAPADLYGQAMALPDGVIVSCFTQCTSVPIEEVVAIAAQLKEGENPRDFKMRLAHEFVEMRYGAKKADAAQAAFVSTFQKHELPTEIPTIRPREFGGIEVRSSVTLMDVLVHTKVQFATSRSDARRLIMSGGVSVDGKIVIDPMFSALVGIADNGRIVKKGKRYFVRITQE